MAVFKVFNSSGKITYPYTSGGGGPNGEGGSSSSSSGSSSEGAPGAPGEQNGTAIGGGGSGVGGHGPIWSDSEQIIWVQAGEEGARYPILVKPGWNDIGFWIPSIYPEDVWIEVPIIIDAPGYILFPAGFEWEVVTSNGAPKRFENRKMTDRLQFSDLFDIVIEKAPVPIDLDNILDNIELSDFIDTVLQKVDIASKEFIEELTFDDIHQIELSLAPFDGDSDSIIEDTKIEDVVTTSLINVNINEEKVVEALTMEDTSDNDKMSITDVVSLEINKEG